MCYCVVELVPVKFVAAPADLSALRLLMLLDVGLKVNPVFDALIV